MLALIPAKVQAFQPFYQIFSDGWWSQPLERRPHPLFVHSFFQTVWQITMQKNVSITYTFYKRPSPRHGPLQWQPLIRTSSGSSRSGPKLSLWQTGRGKRALTILPMAETSRQPGGLHGLWGDPGDQTNGGCAIYLFPLAGSPEDP